MTPPPFVGRTGAWPGRADSRVLVSPRVHGGCADDPSTALFCAVSVPQREKENRASHVRAGAGWSGAAAGDAVALVVLSIDVSAEASLREAAADVVGGGGALDAKSVEADAETEGEEVMVSKLLTKRAPSSACTGCKISA